MNGIASYEDANKAFGPEFSGTIGKHDYKQYVRATIVGANVDLGNRSGALNTNLEQIVTIEGNGMKPVNFYIPTASEEQLKGAFKRVNEFTLKERVIDPVKRLGERIGEAFTSATESIVKFLTPESPVSEKQDSPEIKDLEIETHELNEEEQEVLNDFTKQLKGIEDEIILETKLPPLPNEECKGCSEKESILKQAGKASEKLLAAYADFAEEYPNLAEHGMSALNIAVQTLVGGPLGSINAVRAELTGAAVGAVAGEQMQIVINAAIEKGAEEIMERDHTVSLVEAKSMATISLYGGMTAAEGAKLGKQVLKEGLKLTKIRPDTVDKVGANYPRNSHYAGETFMMKDVPDGIKVKYPNLETKYPNGVNFDEKGFARFEPYMKKEVKVEGLTGNHMKDFDMANKAAGYKTTPDGYTWHHHEDGITMQLVPRDLHIAVSHTGGAATIKHGHKVKKEGE